MTSRGIATAPSPWMAPTSSNAGPRTDFGWEVWPDALYDMLMRVTADYDRPVLEVTENGCSYADAPGPDGKTNPTPDATTEDDVKNW